MRNRPLRDTQSDKVGRRGHRQVSGFFDDRDWIPSDIIPDKGEDILVRIFENGIFTGLSAFIQVKSTTDLDTFRLASGDVSYPIPTKDIDHWVACGNPVFIVTWDTRKKSGHWFELTDLFVQELDTHKSDWRTQDTVNIHFASQNRMDDAGLLEMRSLIQARFAPMFASRPMKINVDIEVSDAEMLNRIRRHEEAGEPLVISGDKIKDIEMPDWWERQNGLIEPNKKTSVSINPLPSQDDIPHRLKILSATHKNLGILCLTLRPKNIGTKEATFTNEHSRTPFLYHLWMRIEEVNGAAGISFKSDINMNDSRPTIQEALSALPFLAEMSNGEIFLIENLRSGLKLRAPASPTQIVFNADYSVEELQGLLKLAIKIQERTGQLIHFPNWDLTRKNAELIQRVALILDTGRTVYSGEEVTMTLQGPSNEQGYAPFLQSLLKLAKSRDNIDFKTQSAEVSVQAFRKRDTSWPMHSTYNRSIICDKCSINRGITFCIQSR